MNSNMPTKIIGGSDTETIKNSASHVITWTTMAAEQIKNTKPTTKRAAFMAVS